MSESTQNNNSGLVLAIVVILIAAVGGYIYYKETQTETFSMDLGGKEISATFEK